MGLAGAGNDVPGAGYPISAGVKGEILRWNIVPGGTFLPNIAQSVCKGQLNASPMGEVVH